MQMQRTMVVLLIVVVSCPNALLMQNADTDIQDYCEFDKWFEPQCELHQVIMINHARYGRMRTGRCIPTDSDTMGCSMDAIGILGAKCSGRRSCQVLIVDIPPTDNPPCPIQLRGYLEVAYDCVNGDGPSPWEHTTEVLTSFPGEFKSRKIMCQEEWKWSIVITPTRGYCQRNDVTEVGDNQGYFASLITEETGCGAPDSPWWIAVETGQTITIRLMTSYAGHGSPPSHSAVYATISEEGETSTATSRSDITSATRVYSSDSTTVKVSLLLNGHLEYFLLGFEVSGCPNVKPKENSWQRQDGNEIFIGCNDDDTEHKWTLRCEGTEWMGHTGECPPGKERKAVKQASDSERWSFATETNALAIPVGIGIAVLIGICLLVTGLIYICKHHKSNRRPPSQPVSESRRGRVTSKGRRSPVKEDDCECDHSDTEYYGTWELNRPKCKQYSQEARSSRSLDGMPLPPPPPPYTQPCVSKTDGCNRGDDEHICERPIFANGAGNLEQGGERNSKYYELDPDFVEPLNDGNA